MSVKESRTEYRNGDERMNMEEEEEMDRKEKKGDMPEKDQM